MKKIADLYVRVSTDEQADRGYSQRNQEEVLRKYCQINDITIRDVIYEDHSAKTFIRPQWNKLLEKLRKNKNKTDLVLFTKWDRFSRNAGDAYQMINILRKLGVEPQGIEQPLDLSIPENKMMLAFYLAAPEVENDRRALNTFHGMRRARKEGRYMGLAPAGYINRIREDGAKYIAFDEPEASIIKWAFVELAKGVFNTEQIFFKAKKKGLKCSRNNFWRLIRNPVYCGKITVPKYKDEEAKYVTGQHKALITETLFNEVQEVLDGRGRNFRPKIVTKEPFPLRGFFMCPECNKILTGSISKGRNNYYAYYHCSAGCRFRINADSANTVFMDNLKMYIPIAEIGNVYKNLIIEAYKESDKVNIDYKIKLVEEINDYKKRIAYIRDLLSKQQIDVLDYSEMNSNYKNETLKLEQKLSNISESSQDVKDLLSKGVLRLLELNQCYKDGGWIGCRELIGSIFPENFTIVKNTFRTARVNEVLELIYMINRALFENKNGIKKDLSSLSRQVAGTGLEPVTFGL
ncbi:recombinase family protein [Flavobacterium sp. HJJ]|uniref:recombinase family protein n=1 Tax=Flavobacterium sp. HJJ TaxID=2783792 RepID=UPI00188AA515|nr:recombinase family protein [Flavobacterium sp. HJJ]MBF4473423.1 recombinase family protein [Flavobacterium sp. HJJ]